MVLSPDRFGRFVSTARRTRAGSSNTPLGEASSALPSGRIVGPSHSCREIPFAPVRDYASPLVNFGGSPLAGHRATRREDQAAVYDLPMGAAP